MNRDRHDPPFLAPDDPRLSEWLDGRLTAPEAAAIERLVAASPELTKLVADLRGMRGRLGAVPVTPPPAGFVRDVLAAIDAAGDEAADDAEVEEEWRRIERQRLEGEIAEAVDDAAEPAAEPMRQRWPWLALAGALAAGVLVAVVINRPGGMGDREVALAQHEGLDRDDAATARPAETAPQDAEGETGFLREKAGEEGDRARKRALADSAPRAPDQDQVVDGETDVSGRNEAADLAAHADSVKRGLAQGGGGQRGAGGGGEPPAEAGRAGSAEEKQIGGTQGAQGAAGPGEAKPGAAPPAARSQALANAARVDGLPIRTVTYRIRSAADRARLDELLAASRGADGVAARRAVEPKGSGAAYGKTDTETERRARLRALSTPPPGGLAVTERIEIAGPAAAIAGLAASLEADADADVDLGRKRDRIGKPGNAPSAGHSVDKPTDGRILKLQPDAGAGGTLPQAIETPRGQAEGLAEAAKAAATLAMEPQAVLVIEVVDETLTEAGEGRP